MAEDLTEVGKALERHAWDEALTLLGQAGVDDPAALELRARAAYGAGDLEGCVGSWERLHVVLLQRGEPAEAAVAAAHAALFLLIDTGLMAPVRGWVARAGRALEDVEGPTPADAVLATVLTYERFLSGDPEAAGRHARDAVDLGGRFGLSLPVAFGRVAQARLTILAGRVAEGLTLLDEVGSTLLSGQVDELAAGMLMCELVCAAQGLGDHERAREWTTVMDAWRSGRGFGTIHGRCRLHKAELLRESGPGDAAEEEALAACEELRPWMRREYGWPLTELGTIRLRRGDLVGAAEAFDAAQRHGWAPQPGQALLRLAVGDDESAAREIAHAIAEPLCVPSKEHPPFGDLRLAPLLQAQAEIAAVRGDAVTARAAAGRLTDIVVRFPNTSLDAAAALTAARAALVSDHAQLARIRAERAVAIFDRAEAVFEASCARGVLGQALAKLGKDDSATQAWAAAATGFARFGPSYWADSLTLQARTPSKTRLRTAPQLRGVFATCGDRRTIEFLGRRAVVRDLTGYRALAHLLQAPGVHIAALDLVESAPAKAARFDHGELVSRRGPDAALPMLDDQSIAAYRRRLEEIEADLAEADATGDPRRSEQAQIERTYLVTELARATGLGGRARTTGSTAERARTSVTRAIRYAITSLADHHPEIAAHLEARVRTGTYCWYEPDPAAPIHWETGEVTTATDRAGTAVPGR